MTRLVTLISFFVLIKSFIAYKNGLKPDDDADFYTYIRLNFKISGFNLSEFHLSRNTSQNRSLYRFVPFAESVGIECPVSSNLTWYYQSAGKKVIKLSTSEKISFEPTTGSLFIRNFDLHDSGFYICKMDYTEISFLLLLKDETINQKAILMKSNNPRLFTSNPVSFEKFQNEFHTFQKVPENVIIDDTSGLAVFYAWNEFSVCDQRNITSREGYCRVFYLNNTLKSETEAASFFLKLNQTFYPHGWPCNTSVHFSFFSFEFLKRNVFYDLIEYKPCAYDIQELEKIEHDKIVICLSNSKKLKGCC